MKNLHIKFEYPEAIAARRELLSTEMNLLEFLQKFKNYKNLRRRELILKSRLKREMAFLKTGVTKTEEDFPKEEEEKEIKEIQKIIRVKCKEERNLQENKDIAAQLKEIREKLNSLGRL